MIEDIIALLENVPKLGEKIAEAAAPLVEQAAKKTAAAGIDPEGKPWPVRKKDGARALQHAASAVSAEASGDLVTIVLEGNEYWHQKAKEGASLPKRKVIPDPGDPIPPEIAKAIRKGAEQLLAKTLGGSR